MSHEEYVKKVCDGDYPRDPSVPLPDGFDNAAGKIENLLFTKHFGIASVALISSVKGAIRSNHYHKTDFHFMYVLEGRMDYYWRPAGSRKPCNIKVYLPGEMMFTPPMIEHATYFAEPTKILTFARLIRSHKEHEEDLVRVNLIKLVGGMLESCE